MIRLLTILLFAVAAAAQNTSFIVLTGVASIATLADSYTTSWERKNWLATPQGQYAPCVQESSEPWLYGKHPTAAKSYGVGVAKIALATGLSFGLKKAGNRMWAMPLGFLAVDSSIGAIHNFMSCPQGIGQ